MNNEKNNILKFEKFFDYNLKVKKLMNDLMPNEMDFYNDDARFKYADKLFMIVDQINTYISKMMLDFNFPVQIIQKFELKINGIKNKINTKEFYNSLNLGYDYVLKFINDNISNMRVDFVDSVKKELMGYTLFYGDKVMEPNTINEFLHYVHSYVINNEEFYNMIPVNKTTSENGGCSEVNLRGLSNEIGNEIYENIVYSDLNSDYIDIINLEKRMLIMARDLGHATVIEIDLSENEILVKYYIPKNTNVNKTSRLRGLRENKEFATGSFCTTKDKIALDLSEFMKGIATDFDYETSNKI